MGCWNFRIVKQNYSIDEILNAVDELQDKRKESKSNDVILNAKDDSEIPKNTLKLIEEAEKE